MNLFYLSWKNITSKPLSMALSLLLLALGVGLISILLLVTTQIEDKFAKNQAGIDLIIGAKGSPLQLTLSAVYHIDNPTGNISLAEFENFATSYQGRQQVKQAIPISSGDSYQGYRIIGTTHDYPALYQAKIREGKLWGKPFEVTVGQLVAERLGLKIGDTFASEHGTAGEGGTHDHNPMYVVGILERTGSVIDQLLLTSTETVWEVHATEGEPTDSVSKEVTAMLVFCRNKLGTLTLPNFINKNTKMQAASPAREMARLYLLTGNLEDALRLLAYVIIIVSGLSIFISLFNSLKERQYELALMRVMGSSRVRLFVLVILEGLVLAALGYIMGIGLSHLAMGLLAGYMEESYQYDFSGGIFLMEEFYLLVGALGVGFLAAVVPAVRASLMDIATTLTKR